jgi:phytoene dehydrogenase-like protein
MREIETEAIVIGAGAGGMCAAARLAANGIKPVLVEAMDKLGGRASTEVIEGFTINTGAIALEVGGVFEETFHLVGAPLDLRFPEPASVFYLDGKIVDVGRGGWGLLLGQMTKQAARILDKFAEARTGQLPDGRQSTAEWLTGFTGNETVHALFRNLCAAIFACNADELPARAFLTYFTSKGAFKRFGFSPTGTIGAWRSLADGIRRHGGEIWLSTAVSRIEIDAGRIAGVTVQRGGEAVRLRAPVVISNAGPRATVALAGEANVPSSYRDQLANLRPAANIVFNFASRQPLIGMQGIATFGRTRRLCNMAAMTATCPELAPPGWHLYVAYAVPKPALGDFDAQAETNLALEDLREQLPGFGQAKMLSIRVMRDDWPAQRSCAGYDLPRDTGVPGLWCVGDAVKVYGNGGTQACAESAKLVVDAIVAARAEGAAA